MKTFIIAEAGVNHNGSVEIAMRMVDIAADAGADAIKFQTFKAEKLVTGFAEKAEYQKRTTGQSASQYDMLRRLELSVEAHKAIIERCRERGIIFVSSPFDPESIALLAELGLDIFKVPSGEITNLPYLRKLGSLGKQVILSTGMADLGEVEDAVEVLVSSGIERKNLTILHCNTAYPTPFEDVNLLAMLTIRDALKVKVGYSDHTTGIDIPLAAVALGAAVIEKHFTLDRSMEGPDHQASLEPGELKAMVSAIRNIERALGDGIKQPSPSEQKNKSVARKSIVALIGICSGEVFSEKNLTIKRPGTGISPMWWDTVLGRRAPRDFQPDELIEI